MYIDTLFDAAAPSAEPGNTFTANQGPNVIPVKGAYLDHFEISLFADVGTATVLETAVTYLSQFTFKAGQETRIQLNAVDLIALMAAFYKELPRTSPDGSSNNIFCFGIKVPVQEAIQQGVTYTWAANYTAVTNVTVNKLVLQAVWLNSVPQNKPAVIAVPVSWTTPGATGMSAVNARIQNLGNLLGLLVFVTTNITQSSDVAGIQRIQLVENGKQTSLLSGPNGSRMLGMSAYDVSGPLSEVLMNYYYWSFELEPIDVHAGYLEFIADVEATSDADRLIPIVLKS